MKKKALLKDTVREIKKSFGRFISIFAIVGIGVAFYAGIKASVPIMKGSADTYFNDYNLMDYKIQSTLGMSSDDVKELSKIEGVDGVYASHSMDTLSTRNASQSVVKVLSLPLNAKANDKEYINQYRLVEGRMPENENECIMEADVISPSGYKLGDSITLSSGTSDDILDSLKHKTYKVVGKVMTPYYMSYEKGSAAIGNGKVSRYIAIADSNFKSDIYSEVYITVKGARDYNSYDDAYFDYIEPIEKRIKKISGTQENARLESVKKDAQRELDKGIAEYEENKKTYDTKIAEAKAELADGERQLQQGKADLASSIKSTEDMFASKEQELKDGKAQIASLQIQYDDGMRDLQNNKADYDAKKPELQQQLNSLQSTLDKINQGIAGIDMALQNPALSDQERAAYETQRKELVENQQKTLAGITTLQNTMASYEQQFADGEAKLAQLKQAIDTNSVSISDGEAQLEDGRAKAQREFADAQKSIDDSAAKLATGKAELEKEERDGSEKLSEAKEKLDKAQRDIDDLKKGTWYILDRHSHYSYMDYGGAADRMDGIAKVFPVFFYLVAALVCLTTMTRMVDEQRQEIGTLKALGYTRFYIAMKYIAYAGIASIAGGIFGAVVGMIIFPTVIYNAWGIMYLMPSVKLHFETAMAASSIGIASFVTVAAAVFACYKELMETPALLMRPKAPKNGKKIFLERITFLWKHFNFIHKVTARNIFRYKKRFLMTVIGISGCTALLVAGYGVQDSIEEIVATQYGEIFDFDMSLTYNKDVNASKRSDLNKELEQDKRLSDNLEVSIQHGTFRDKGEDQGIDLYVTDKQKDFEKFVDLRTRKGHDSVEIEKDGAVITEHLANRQDLSIGDTIAIDNGDGQYRKVKITGICENYVGHALYMSDSYYKSVFHERAKPTGQLIKIKEAYIKDENGIGNTYMKNKTVESLQFYSSLAASFDDMISSLSFIVVVLIISAGLLAFVVLYNLTNVNISERLREIATIKVLGFYDNEVSAYVYRENIFLTLIGTFVGLFLGIALHSLIMDLAELDNIMFGRNIDMMSFIWSFLITLVFAIIVNLVMYRKLKRIPMVESLKSIE